MAIRSFQVTQTGAKLQVSASLPVGFLSKAKWVTFQNNAAAVMRVGDVNTSATQGIALAGGSPGGSFSTISPGAVSTFGADLAQWYTIGTATQVLDVVYDDENF